MPPLFKILHIFLLFLISERCFSITVDNNTLNQAVWQHAEIYVDPTRQTTIEDILKQKNPQFRPMGTADLNPGVSGDKYWLRFPIRTNFDDPHYWIMHAEVSYLDYMNVYLVSDDKVVHRYINSDQDSFSQRSFEYRLLNTAHFHPANTQYTAYVETGMLRADTLSLNIRISDVVKFERFSKREQMIMGMFYGSCLTLILISALLGWILRSKIYVIYSGYLLTNMLLWGFLNGYVFQFLLPEYGQLVNYSYHVIYFSFAIMAIQFSRSYLETKNISPRLDSVLKWAQLIFIFGIVIRFFGIYAFPTYLSFIAILSLCFLPIVGYFCFKKSVTYAKWYIVAWVIYALTLFLSALAALSNTIEWGMKPLLAAQFASLLESFLLALALIEKVKQLNSEISIVTQDSMRDELTQLGNRRFLNTKTNQIFKYLKSNESLSLILIDADYFKQVNDQYGHTVGDKVLIHLADTIREVSRPHDIVARYGGEEFVMIVRTFDQDSVKAIAERLRHRIKTRPYKDEQHEIGLSVSLGVCPIRSTDIKQAIQFADIALYHAKAVGRDTACLYIPESHKVDVIASTL